MISIRMAMRQVKKITKLIRNVKPIMVGIKFIYYFTY